jgi:hypothetical protein
MLCHWRPPQTHTRQVPTTSNGNLANVHYTFYPASSNMNFFVDVEVLSRFVQSYPYKAETEEVFFLF